MTRKIILIVIAILIIFCSVSAQMLKEYPAACDAYSKTKVKGNISLIVNKTLCDKLNTIGLEYDEISTIIKDENKDISYIYVNTSLINGIALEFASKIQNILETEICNYGIPIGNLIGLRVLSGKGAKIQFDILPAGATTYKYNNELLSSGINQTLHRIKIVFTTEIICMYPFHQCCFELENEIVIAETLIIGDVPDVIVQR